MELRYYTVLIGTSDLVQKDTICPNGDHWVGNRLATNCKKKNKENTNRVGALIGQMDFVRMETWSLRVNRD